MLAEIHLQFRELPGEPEDRTELVEVNSETELHNLAYKMQAQENAENVNFNFVEEGNEII
jgi:hypothetical protein